jgi:hypothetical protein
MGTERMAIYTNSVLLIVKNVFSLSIDSNSFFEDEAAYNNLTDAKKKKTPE